MGGMLAKRTFALLSTLLAAPLGLAQTAQSAPARSIQAVPTTSAVAQTAVTVSGAVAGRIVPCPASLKLQARAVCLLAAGNADALKPRISAKVAGQVVQEWQVRPGGKTSTLIVKGPGGALAYVLLTQLNAKDTFAVIDAPADPAQAGTPAAAPAPTTRPAVAATPPAAPAQPAAPAPTTAGTKAPTGATRGVTYAAAADLQVVLGVRPLGKNQYRFDRAGQNITLTAFTNEATLNGGSQPLPGNAYLVGTQLYVPVIMLRSLGCTVTPGAGSSSVACGGPAVSIKTTVY